MQIYNHYKSKLLAVDKPPEDEYNFSALPFRVKMGQAAIALRNPELYEKSVRLYSPEPNSRQLLDIIRIHPCPVCPGDEIFRNGIFQFNITRMLDYIQHDSNDFTLEEVLVNDFPREFSSINESHIESIELAAPVILAEISPGSYNLIDGNHRMEKARRSGVVKLMAYRLTVEQHIQFLIDKKAYESYVEYWNYQLK